METILEYIIPIIIFFIVGGNLISKLRKPQEVPPPSPEVDTYDDRDDYEYEAYEDDVPEKSEETERIMPVMSQDNQSPEALVRNVLETIAKKTADADIKKAKPEKKLKQVKATKKIVKPANKKTRDISVSAIKETVAGMEDEGVSPIKQLMTDIDLKKAIVLSEVLAEPLGLRNELEF